MPTDRSSRRTVSDSQEEINRYVAARMEASERRRKMLVTIVASAISGGVGALATELGGLMRWLGNLLGH